MASLKVIHHKNSGNAKDGKIWNFSLFYRAGLNYYSQVVRIRQVEAEVVSNSRNKLHQTTYQDLSRSLYRRPDKYGTIHYLHYQNEQSLLIEHFKSTRLSLKSEAEIGCLPLWEAQKSLVGTQICERERERVCKKPRHERACSFGPHRPNCVAERFG